MVSEGAELKQVRRGRTASAAGLRGLMRFTGTSLVRTAGSLRALAQALLPTRTASGGVLSSEPSPRQQLVSSRLFDVNYYARQAGLPAAITECVDHYLREGARRGYRPSRLFDRDAYLSTHPDVRRAGADPFVHFVCHGMHEGRRSAAPKELLREVRALSSEALAATHISARAALAGWVDDAPSLWADKAVAVYASSLGNFFFKHIADRIADGLRSDGIRVYRLNQNSARPGDTDVDLFVAPHEFFHLGAGRSWREHPAVRRSVMVNTEQPGTTWYFLTLTYAGTDATLLDFSPHSAVLLEELGWGRSGYLPLGWVRKEDSRRHSSTVSHARGLETLSAAERERPAHRAAWSDRPIDVLFLGTLTPRRGKALASLAPALAAYRCFIHAPTGNDRPLTGGSSEIGIEHSLLLARRSKILLNLHRDEFPYFEWHRVMSMGVEQGAVVLSEPCLPYPGVEPGRHFVEASLDGMTDRLHRLLGGPEGPAAAATAEEAAQKVLRERFDLSRDLRAAAFVHSRGGQPRA